tara:strand:- start:497 stop:700 length:204 start_codon:yes stop_codon:yes gene_type:complete
MSKSRIDDNIEDLNIALRLITRVRCHSRAGGIAPKYSYATREQRKILEKAAKMIVEVLNELKGDELQ